jgi:cytochrome c oxidase subunit 2
MKPILWIVGLVVVGGWSLAQAAGDATAGQALYAPCTVCHGQQAEGNAALHAPALAGQEGWYLVRQLSLFKAGIRGTDPGDTFGLQMRPMALTLATDQAVEDVVAYIQTLTPANTTPTLDGQSEQGERRYALCATCHGQQAEGNRIYHAPRLGHQYDWYLLTQLKHFKAGIRGQPPKDTYGMQMQAVARTLRDEQAMKDVIAHIKSLGQSYRDNHPKTGSNSK